MVLPQQRVSPNSQSQRFHDWGNKGIKKSAKNVKREIRILGLDTCNSTTILGAIVRGGLFLDGVIALGYSNDSAQLARDIIETKYFPELKVIMMHDPTRILDAQTLRRITKLPLITTQARANSQTRTKPGGKQKQLSEWKSLGMDILTLRRILLLTNIKRQMPEPVRIAHLLAKLHIFGKLSHDKG